MKELHKQESSAVIEELKSLYKPQTIEVDANGNKAQVLITPQGLTITPVKPFADAYLKAPERRKGTAELFELNSFCAHVNRFKDKDSAVFANNNMENPSLTAVLDYHCEGSDSSPRFGEHRALYKFPLSEEWKEWCGSNGKKMSQGDFAYFIENNIGSVRHPNDGDTENDSDLSSLAKLLGGVFATPNQLVTLSRGLQVNENARVKSANNLSSGETSLVYETEHTDEHGAPIKVPNLFLITIPVFNSGALYRVAVRLRYRLRGGEISWLYEMYRIDKVFEDAFNEACETVRKETELPLFVGRPE